MAGTTLASSSHSWILDTRAMNHMKFDLQYLSSLVACDSLFFIQLSSGKTTKIVQIGTYTLFPTSTSTNFLHVHDFHYNLLSISKLTKELNFCVIFNLHFCLLQDLYSGEIKGIGKVRGDLYILHSTLTPVKRCSCV